MPRRARTSATSKKRVPSFDPPPAFRDNYAASQFRVETWNELKDLAEQLQREPENGDQRDELRARTEHTIQLLERIENYWAYPGVHTCAELERMLGRSRYRTLSREVARIVRMLVSDLYRQRDMAAVLSEELDDDAAPDTKGEERLQRESRPYFEVLVVDDVSTGEEREVRRNLLETRREDDEFIYDVVVVPSFVDAVIAVLFNHNIQSCVLRYRFPVEARLPLPELRHYLAMVPSEIVARAEAQPADALALAIGYLRPELDLFKVTDDTSGSVSASVSRCFRRVFYRQEDYLELHLSILKGIRERYDTPFFTALREYSQKPTGVFHALPISRGKSITNSHWIRDMGRFYGRNIFLAETSSTTGGLDSLLQPTGPLKKAQEKVARAFGSRHSFFITNGTSTANKVVTQALVRPGDLVLLSHDCHKSHPYALVLAGALPVYMDAYPLQDFAIFGGVPLAAIKRQLFELKQAGKLDRVRMLLLTNCTFDGIVYDPLRVMREVLAIKPDMIFLWDEAWFAFARATPSYRQRTAMHAARTLRTMARDEGYRSRYARWKEAFSALDPAARETWVEHELLPDPEQMRVRVYATQSTHKTLTSLRQGSMIHVHDQDFEQLARHSFHEAYMTHTSTSPNYQILASLDVGRRQLEFEGYEMVRNSVGLAMMIRRAVVDHPLLSRYFKLLRAKELIPEEFRPSGLERFYDPENGFTRIEEHWRSDEFALDPTRITMDISATGMDGDTFRRLLIERFDIQINKTSRNTVLFMLNIGSTRGSATYLLDVLVEIAEDLEECSEESGDLERRETEGRVRQLNTHPPLPTFSRFHPAFVDDPTGDTPEGDMRQAFFLASDPDTYEHLMIGAPVRARLAEGRPVVSSSFVTPYPPGFPVLVPGQIVTEEIMQFLEAVDVKEIHGYEPQFGLRIFKEELLDKLMAASAAATAGHAARARKKV